jgi:hypothetical protein
MFSVFNGIPISSQFHRYFIGIESVFYRYFIGESNLSVMYQYCIGIEPALNRYLSLSLVSVLCFSVIHGKVGRQRICRPSLLALYLFQREDRLGLLLSMRCRIPVRLDEDVVPARIGKNRRGLRLHWQTYFIGFLSGVYHRE